MKPLQVIKSLNGRAEYVLLPIDVYNSLQDEIEQCLTHTRAKKGKKEDYVSFLLEEYIDNPIALARIKIGMTQEDLAKKLEVSQAYISKIEAQEKVSPKTLQKVLPVIKASSKKSS